MAKMMAKMEDHLKQQVMKELEKLPLDKFVEVLDFVVFLRTRASQEKTHLSVSSLPASSLDYLTGLAAWGGDALTDTERLYDESF